MTGPAGNFAETAALLAYLEDDHDKLAELLDDMLPGELATYASDLDGLRQRVLDVRARKRREAYDAADAHRADVAARDARARDEALRNVEGTQP